MKNNNNQSHKNLCISSNNISRKIIKKIFSSEITPKSSKNSKQKNLGSPIINFGGIIKNNRKTKNNVKNMHINKSIENLKVLKINGIHNLPNCINTPMKVIKIVSSPSITTLNNTISINHNTINHNIKLDLFKNKGSIDCSSPVNENDESLASNNLLSEIINKYKNESMNRNNKLANHSQLNTNHLIIENNTNNHLMIPTKTYYGSPKNEKRKKGISYRMDDFQYNSFNKRGKLKNYLKKSFKEKYESKKISNCNENNNNNNLLFNKNNYTYYNKKKEKPKKSKNITHQKSNPLMKIKKNKYLSQSQISSNVSNIESKTISKNNIDFNKSCLRSFFINKKNVEKDTMNNSFLTKREKDKNNIKTNSIDIQKKEKENKKENENLSDEINNNLKELKDKLMIKIETLENEKNILNTKISELNEQNEQLNNIINEKEKIIQEKKDIYNNDKKKYEKTIKDNKFHINNLIKEIKDLKTTNTILNNKIINVNKEKVSLKNELNFKNNEYLELIVKKKDINNLLQKAKEKNEKINYENKRLNKENNELKNRINNYIKNIDEYKQINENYKNKFEEFEQKIEFLTKSNNDLMLDLEYKNQNIMDLNSEINNLNYLKYNYEEIKNEYPLTENNIQNSENTNDNIHNKIQKITNEINNNKYQKISEINLEYINNMNKNYICLTEIKSCSKNNRIISPDNYNLIKSFSINSNLKWFLFKKKTKINDNNNSFNNISNNKYNNYIWVANDSIKNINEFASPNNISKSIKNNSSKSARKEQNVLNINNNFIKLRNNQENLSDNKRSKKLIKSNTDTGFIGLSFINQDERETSNFLDDYCFEEILNDLGENEFKNNTKNYNIYNIHNNNNKIYFNTPKKYYPNNINNYSKSNTGNIIYKKENIKKYKKNNLKDTIDTLLTQITPTSNAMNTLTSILKQLGCLDDDIFKLIGNYNNTNKNDIDNKKNK